MLVIRLARTGRAKYPTYRIVAAESARAATGRFVEVLGHYNPHTKELVVKRDAVAKRLSNGAQPSNTVAKLLVRDGGVELPAWVKVKSRRDAKAAEVAAAATAADVTPEEAAADADGTDEVRVGTTTEDAVVDTADDNAVNINDTETAASDESVQADAEAAQDAAAKAAGTDK